MNCCLSQIYTIVRTDMSMAAVLAFGSPSYTREAKVSNSVADVASRRARRDGQEEQ